MEANESMGAQESADDRAEPGSEDVHSQDGENGSGAQPGGPNGDFETGAERPDLAADLRTLGVNLREALRAAWGSQERERLQAEIETGLRDLGQTLRETFDQATQEVRSRERVRERVAEVKQKAAGAREELRSGKVGDRARAEIHDVLNRLNEQLRRSQGRWTPPGSGERSTTDG